MLGDPRLQAIAEKVGCKFGDTAVIAQTLVLAEEAGEAVQQVRRYKGWARQPASRDDLREEFADVFITVAVLALLADVDLAEAVDRKLTKIQERGGL